jgi:hypothetical protein
LATDAQIPPEIQASNPRSKQLLAPWWHTVIVIALLLLASVNGTRGKHALGTSKVRL